MSQKDGLNRRSFLRNAGLTALAGAVTASTPLGASAAGSMFDVTDAAAQAGGKFDFDTVYNRFGTNSVKFDQQIRMYGKDSVQVGMGIADIDFKAAPSITQALMDRMKHENWGYLDTVAYNGEVDQADRGLEQEALRPDDRSRDGRPSPRACTPASSPRCSPTRLRAARWRSSPRPTTASTVTSRRRAPPPKRA